MNQSDIQWLNDLFKQFGTGTIAQVLLDGDLQRSTMVGVLKHLVTQSLNERKVLEDENAKYSKILKEHGLYRHDILFPEL